MLKEAYAPKSSRRAREQRTDYDKFFKASLKEKRIAIDFLKAHLLARLLARIELDRLELTDKSVVSARLRELHRDIVDRCRIDAKAASILLLLEPQSPPDKLLPVRQLQYKVGRMADALGQGTQRLPRVIRRGLYHGQAVDVFALLSDPDDAQQYFLGGGLIDLR